MIGLAGTGWLGRYEAGEYVRFTRTQHFLLQRRVVLKMLGANHGLEIHLNHHANLNLTLRQTEIHLNQSASLNLTLQQTEIHLNQSANFNLPPLQPAEIHLNHPQPTSTAPTCSLGLLCSTCTSLTRQRSTSSYLLTGAVV